MKRYGNLYEKIVSLENIKLAHQKARKNKTWYKEVKMIDANPEPYFKELQQMLINHTYQTSKYEIFTKVEGNKERQIYKLPYFPDHICQWAILLVIEPIILKYFTSNTYSAIPNRGIHKCLNDVKKAMRNDIKNCQYCLKLDVKKFYPSINHNVLKSIYRKIFKDEDLLWLIDEIIDSTPGDVGIPIGNYLSQYSGNIYLTPFDHWIKEEKHIKHYFRYMDDIVIFSDSKEHLHKLRKEIEIYFSKILKVRMKENYQIFPTYKRGIDFVGYRIFLNYTLLRKSTCKSFKRKMIKINKKRLNGKEINHSEWCSVASYKGWLDHCDSYRLREKYIKPIERYANSYYIHHIKRKVDQDEKS